MTVTHTSFRARRRRLAAALAIGFLVAGTGTTALADGLWLSIDAEHILTHGEAADNEDGVYAHAPYGPRTTCERWDLEYLGTRESPIFNPWAEDGSRGGDVLRGKAQYYREHRAF